MYYPCRENKGANQLCGYREADLRLCFRIYRLLVFSRGGSYFIVFVSFESYMKTAITKSLFIKFHACVFKLPIFKKSRESLKKMAILGNVTIDVNGKVSFQNFAKLKTFVFQK